MHDSRLLPLLAVLTALVLVGCSDRSRGDGTAASADPAVGIPVVTLAPELEIGGPHAEAEYEFGRISGLAVASDGRVAVADSYDDAVRIFSADGRLLFRIGRRGAGPGEFAGACCVAFDDEDRLWVRDGGNARYSVFRLFADSARFVAQRRMAHSDANRIAPVTFAANDVVVDVGSRSDPATGEVRTYRFDVDHSGAVAREVVLPQAPPDSTGMRSVQRPVEHGVATLFAYPPFSPDQLYAHSPRGGFAHAVSSAYAVEWRDADGALLHRLAHPLARGPALDADERTAAERQIEREVQRLGVSRTQLGFGVPTHKQPLRNLFFDGAGRLWVELSVPGGAARRAHVYDASGQLEREVTWPSGVDLRFGAVTQHGTWGIATDSLGVQSLVRLGGAFQR